MKLHKYCALLPRMMDDEFQTLKADIKEHGLLVNNFDYGKVVHFFTQIKLLD